MDWQKLFEIFLKFGISGATISLILGYLGKQIIEQFLKSRLEKYKNDLSNESLLFKSNLERLNAENNIRYQKIFEERAILIKEFYKKIYSLEKNIKNLVTTFQGPEWIDDKKRDKNARDSLDIVIENYSENKIFFNKNQCYFINEVINISNQIIKNMTQAKWQAVRENSNPGLLIENAKKDATHFNKWLKCESDVDEFFMPVKNELEDDFRKIFDIK